MEGARLKEDDRPVKGYLRSLQKWKCPCLRSQNNLVPIAVIAVLLLPALLLGLGVSSLWDLDEGMYAEVAREMLLRGDYVAPYFNYQPRFDKPPLHYWVTAGFYHIFGVNEFAARLGSVAFGFLGAVLVYFLGEALFSKRVGLLAAIVLGTNLLYFAESRIGLMDTALTFFMSLSLLAFWLAWSKGDRRYYALLGVAMALGTLTKGPVAVLLPGGIIVIFLGLSEGFRGVWREIADRWALLGAAAFALVALPWHITVWARYGGKFLADYFGYHMFTRFTSAIETHGGPWYYYILVLALGFLPWSGFFLAGAVGWIAGIWRSEGGRFITIWFSVVFLFFSISRTKLPGYILPGLPAVALALALWWDRIFANEASVRIRKRVIAGLSSIGVLGLFLGLILVAAGPRVPPEYAGVARLLFFLPVAVVVGTIITIILFMSTRRAGAAFLATVIMFLLVALGFSVALLPRLESYKPARPLALQAGRLLGDGKPGYMPGSRPGNGPDGDDAGLYGGSGVRDVRAGKADHSGGLNDGGKLRNGELGSMLLGGGDASSVFYARRPVRYILSEEEALAFLRQDRLALLMIPEGVYESLIGRLATSEPAPPAPGPGSGPKSKYGSRMSGNGPKLYVLKRAAGALLISNGHIE